MCGIFFCVSQRAHIVLDVGDEERLRARGPDALRTHNVIIQTLSPPWYLTFTTSVLALRGDKIVSQPIVDQASGSVFCWNGEAWLYNSAEVLGNDTETLAEYLFDAVSSTAHSETRVLEVLGRITGPYAFVFYDARSSIVYYGRDNLGRRSLLWQGDEVHESQLTICSVPMTSIKHTAREVDAMHVHKIDLKSSSITVQSILSSTLQPRINKTLPLGDDEVGPIPSSKAMTDLLDQLRSSLRPRIRGIPTFTTFGKAQRPSRVAILFSGGLDCTLLARLVHHILPHDQPVDLLNVGFENPRVSVEGDEAYDYNRCPDRVTGTLSFQELAKVCQERIWRFVAVNIPYSEFLEHRPIVIQLMHPHDTEMDLSIASALYFAARGKGTMRSSARIADSENLDYTSTARVLLSGLGADELFGGYSRHAAAFSRGGYSALNDELELDFNRIGTRNLGRDDRVMAHWGREIRFPYLDEQFVAFSLGLPAWNKCGFRPAKVVPRHYDLDSARAERMEDLHPEKMLLRCAAWQLGMKHAAQAKKRAIQFGAKSAKMHSGRTKGTDSITAKLLNTS